MKNLLIISIFLLTLTFCTGPKQSVVSDKYYDPIYSNSQELVSVQPKDNSFSCDDIEYLYDKFTEISTFHSPTADIGKLSLRDRKSVAIKISKKITTTDTLFQLGFLGTTDNYKLVAQGVIIILENGEKIDEPDVYFKLVQSSSVADIYLGEFLLTNKMIELLKLNRITDLRLFAYTSLAANDFVVPENEALKLQFYLNCLLSDSYR